jgi:hypothetical protein
MVFLHLQDKSTFLEGRLLLLVDRVALGFPKNPAAREKVERKQYWKH